MSTEQTQAEEAEQEAQEVRRNARARRARAAIDAALLAESREKPADEPGDARTWQGER